MKKLILFCFIIVLAACTYTGCSKEIPANELTLKVAIFPNGGWDETYLFNQKSDGNLEVLFGNRKSDDLWSSDNYAILDIGEKQLTQEQINNVVTLANKVYKNESLLKEGYQFDSWEVVVMINDKTYNYYYGDHVEESLEKLVDVLIKHSPIKVVLRGFA